MIMGMDLWLGTSLRCPAVRAGSRAFVVVGRFLASLSRLANGTDIDDWQ